MTLVQRRDQIPSLLVNVDGGRNGGIEILSANFGSLVILIKTTHTDRKYLRNSVKQKKKKRRDMPDFQKKVAVGKPAGWVPSPPRDPIIQVKNAYVIPFQTKCNTHTFFFQEFNRKKEDRKARVSLVPLASFHTESGTSLFLRQM